jgi:tetraacyldisaccharide 4'-kinase
VPVYRAGLWVKEALRGEQKRLQWPVVSVGSLSAGGAGKTPVVIALALLLKERGWEVDVLSRGYGREGGGVERVDRAFDDAAWRYGDEPVLMERAGLEVWVGAKRYVAGVACERGRAGLSDKQVLRSAQDDNQENKSEKRSAGSVHLLDDGFQHRQLARAVDVVLVTAEDLDDALLPAGNLREPFSAIARADVVVVREEELEAVQGRVWPRMREGAQMWVVRRRLVFPAPMKTLSAGLRPVAFCAIARPEGFAAMLAEAGCGVIETVAYADHHRYTLADVQRVIEVARGLDASGFVTTEKDAVKLSAEMRAALEVVGPVMVVALVAEFVDDEAVVKALEAKLA